MQKINKGPQPASLTAWKRAHPSGNYKQLTEVERQDIRHTCSQEQFYLCAYCCQQISGQQADTMNEHIEARRLAPERSLDFSNIVASCTTPHQCDAAHGSQQLPLTPLMDACETELRFKLSGRVEGLTERASDMIQVLNLGSNEASNKALVEKRKQLAAALLWESGVDPEDSLEDDDLIQLVIDDLTEPEDGKLKPFAPVVVNILQHWLSAPL